MGSITARLYFPPVLDDVGSNGRERKREREKERNGERELYFDASAGAGVGIWQSSLASWRYGGPFAGRFYLL